MEWSRLVGADKRSAYIKRLLESREPNQLTAGKILALQDVIASDLTEGKKQLNKAFPDDSLVKSIEVFGAISIALMGRTQNSEKNAR